MSIDAGHPGISWVLQFRARIDGSLLRLRSPEGTGWDLFIRAGALFLEGTTSSMSLALDMEDTAYLTDGTWHSLAITATAAGSKIFLDGYSASQPAQTSLPPEAAPKLHSPSPRALASKSDPSQSTMPSSPQKKSLPSPPPRLPSLNSPQPTCPTTTSPSCPNSPQAPCLPATAYEAPASTA